MFWLGVPLLRRKPQGLETINGPQNSSSFTKKRESPVHCVSFCSSLLPCGQKLRRTLLPHSVTTIQENPYRPRRIPKENLIKGTTQKRKETTKMENHRRKGECISHSTSETVLAIQMTRNPTGGLRRLGSSSPLSGCIRSNLPRSLLSLERFEERDYRRTSARPKEEGIEV